MTRAGQAAAAGGGLCRRLGFAGWSGGLGVLAGPVWVGEAAEGDLVAEACELADVVADLAADVALALVVVRAEVLIAHAGVGQQLVVDLQLGVPDGNHGFGLA